MYLLNGVGGMAHKIKISAIIKKQEAMDMSNQRRLVYKPLIFSEHLADIVSITPWNGEPLPERVDWGHFLYDSILVHAELKKPKTGLSHHGYKSHCGHKIVEES
jgi:hypothetical protein